MAADDPKVLSARINAAEKAGDAALANEYRRHLILNYPKSPEAERARAAARLDANPPGEPSYDARRLPIAEVRIVDIDVKLWSMVVLLVKLAIAAIPAMIIVTAIVAFVFGLIGGLGTYFR